MKQYAETYFAKLQNQLSLMNRDEINNAIELIEKKWKEGRQIITLGNGGSSITALHFITDWNKSIYMKNGIPFRGRTLVDNIGLLMAYGNDISFAEVFSEQLKNIMSPGDLVIALSGSGNSPNVIKAVEWANQNGGTTLGLSGYSGGKLKEIAQHSVWVDINDMQLCEDIHAIFGHIVMQALCGTLGQTLQRNR